MNKIDNLQQVLNQPISELIEIVNFIIRSSLAEMKLWLSIKSFFKHFIQLGHRCLQHKSSATKNWNSSHFLPSYCSPASQLVRYGSSFILLNIKKFCNTFFFDSNQNQKRRLER